LFSKEQLSLPLYRPLPEISQEFFSKTFGPGFIQLPP
jgi:hypothetical protein